MSQPVQHTSPFQSNKVVSFVKLLILLTRFQLITTSDASEFLNQFYVFYLNKLKGDNELKP